jgi:ABC-type transport system substrate-binding protein
VKTPIKLSLIVTPGSAQDAIGTVLQQDLSKIGVKLKVVQEDYNTANSAINAENFVMGTNNWDDYVGDASEQPQFWINPGYCCQAYFTNYNNPAATALVEKAIVATNPTQVTSLFNQVQKSVATSDHAIPLYYPTFLYVSSSKVAGFNVTPFGVWSFPDMGFKS